MAEETKENTMHEIENKKLKHVEIYRLSPTKHSVDAYTNNLVIIPGLEKTIQIEQDCTDIVVMALGHANALEATNRVDLQIMIDQKQLTMNYPNDPNQYPGQGLSYNPQWVPMISIGSTTLKKGVYHICVGVANAVNNGKKIHCNGTGMIVQIFKPHIVNKWVDIDLDDETLHFNKDLEYQIEIRGKSFANAITVEKENLWFFYSDTTNNQNNGIKNVNYHSKRELNNNYLVTKIQCRMRDP
eukprot:436627_1